MQPHSQGAAPQPHVSSDRGTVVLLQVDPLDQIGVGRPQFGEQALGTAAWLR